MLEKSYKEYMEGFTDISTEKDKKDFAKLFGEYLKIENILQNYDEFTKLKASYSLDMDDTRNIEESHEDMWDNKKIEILKEREIQDYRSTYNDIREWLRREKIGKSKEKSDIDWDDVVFEVDLLKSQEINLDYILELIFEKHKNVKSKESLIEDVCRLVRSSTGNRAKESLIVDFINETDLDKFDDKSNIIDSFFSFAQIEQMKEAEKLIKEEKLNIDAAKRYIFTSLKKEQASDNGTELNEILSKMCPLNPNYLSIFKRISAFVDKPKGIGRRV